MVTRWAWILALSLNVFLLNGYADVDLQRRYPASETIHPTSKVSWTFGQEDIFRLESFRLTTADGLQIVIDDAELCIGHSEVGAVWAAIVLQATGSLVSEATSVVEEVASVWLRFHPSQLNAIFPPASVSVHDATPSLWRFSRMGRHKFRDSFHYGNRALIPPEETSIIDVDTTTGHRRFFVVDAEHETTHYVSAFEDRALPGLVEITDFDAEVSFDRVWKAFNRDYPGFVLRPEIDWDAMYEEYFPRALECTTSYELGVLIADMLSRFRDLHIWVRVGEESIPVYNRPAMLNANPRAAASILGEVTSTPQTPVRWSITENSIGYLAIDAWQGEATPETVHRILELMRDTRGLIMDVRANGGGDEGLALEVASRFVSEPSVYSYSQYRNGFVHTDLTKPRPRSVAPSEWWRYSRPVLLLIGPVCMSSNESFIAMMETSDSVTTMGQRTRGSSGNPEWVGTPAGVEFSVPSWLDLLADQQPLDERGIEPDIVFCASREAYRGDRDALLTAALDTAQEWPEVDTIPDGESYNPYKAEMLKLKSNPPYVTNINPLYGAVKIPKATLSWRYNRPMNPNALSLRWNRGGYHSVRRIAYAEDSQTFSLGLILHPDVQHELVTNPPHNHEPRGFHDLNMIHSRSSQVVFSSSPGIRVSGSGNATEVESLSPTPGAAVPSLLWIDLDFSEPMLPLIPSLNRMSMEENDVLLCPRIEYCEHRTRCRVPVWLRSGMDVRFALSGFRSEQGHLLDPVEIAYTVDDEAVDPVLPTGDEAMKNLLARFQAARTALTAADVQVTLRESTAWNAEGYARFQSRQAAFAWNSDGSWFADISSFMENPFKMGSDGKHVWKVNIIDFSHELEQFPVEQLDNYTFGLMTPVTLFTPSASVKRKEWLEPQWVEGKQCEGIRVWLVETLGKDAILIAQEYWFDPETDLLYVCRVLTSNMTDALYRFDVLQKNDDVRSERFLPPVPESTQPNPAIDLQVTDAHRFVNILDGSDGIIRVRWGSRGPDGRVSEGLN